MAGLGKPKMLAVVNLGMASASVISNSAQCKAASGDCVYVAELVTSTILPANVKIAESLDSVETETDEIPIVKKKVYKVSMCVRYTKTKCQFLHS